ncbi:hypothetical protein [Mesoterricola silvestris]|uniref:Uncharacterized protein n=1 Tax=Mesoterricola silvestris TaxID=2927979 RepID=A0AA48GLE1_9BACT|nr:hypothetical protein [Mesoterricola silvestris]BDU71939.1 hypothetical protein METEAL_11130 [Mesoterricola silvestris]
MPIRRWTPMLATAALLAQDAQPFAEEKPDPWRPAWELRLGADELKEPEGPGGFRRGGVQLRLRWGADWGPMRVEAGTRSAVGSDGNRLNAPRWDQQPSNGTQADVLQATLSRAGERIFGTLRLGLQGNGLLVSQAMWDRDLRFTGAGATAGLHGDVLQEAGVRVAVGRVRTVLGGRTELAAAQGVLKFDTGAFSWTAHAGRWTLAWDPGGFRRHALPGSQGGRQRLTLDAAGAAGVWNGPLPLEAQWFACRNRATREDSEELRLSAGSRERAWWPQLSWTWQRLSSTGTLYPVNGDAWWFYRAARGPRVEAALTLPGRWVAALSIVRQTADGEGYAVTRRMVTLTRRF